VVLNTSRCVLPRLLLITPSAYARRAVARYRKRMRANDAMYDGIQNAARRVLCCRYRRGADGSRDSDDAGARCGSRRLVLVLTQELPGSQTCWPEGRRRGRAGGRQEYRHFSSLAQPWVRRSRAGTRCELRAESVAYPPCPLKIRPPLSRRANRLSS